MEGPVKLLGALGLLVALLMAAFTIFIQSLMLLAFVNDASSNSALASDRRGRLLVAIVVILSCIGVLAPPILFWLEASWGEIWLAIALGLGGTWFMVLVIACRFAK